MHASNPPEARARRRGLATLTACVVTAFGCSGAVAAEASAAASITVPEACVIIDPNALGGSPMVVDGSGFNPNDSIDITTSVGGGHGLVTADASGNFVNAPITAPIFSTLGPAASVFTLKALDESDGVTTAMTSFHAANLAANANPAQAKVGKKVRFTFSGFTAGAQIYGHYLHRGKLVRTMRMGRAIGPCGTLKTRAPLFPRGIRYQNYKVQYDDSRRYSKKALPRLIATLTTVTV